MWNRNAERNEKLLGDHINRCGICRLPVQLLHSDDTLGFGSLQSYEDPMTFWENLTVSVS